MKTDEGRLKICKGQARDARKGAFLCSTSSPALPLMTHADLDSWVRQPRRTTVSNGYASVTDFLLFQALVICFTLNNTQLTKDCRSAGLPRLHPGLFFHHYNTCFKKVIVNVMNQKPHGHSWAYNGEVPESPSEAELTVRSKGPFI